MFNDKEKIFNLLIINYIYEAALIVSSDNELVKRIAEKLQIKSKIVNI
ncbi:MAG: hypothetical protein ACP5RT_01770 [Candidatus Micrarchaeia archaeon]